MSEEAKRRRLNLNGNVEAQGSMETCELCFNISF